MKLNEAYLTKVIRPMIINCWNFNNSEQAESVLINYVFFPNDLKSDSTPSLRFSLVMKNGRVQDSLNCDKYFISFINDISDITYRYLIREI